MRVAEIVMAFALAALSIGIMVKASELPIGWIPGSGPGPGAFPFWLGLGMLGCCIVIAARWFLRLSPQSQSDEPYFDRRSLNLFLIGAVPLAVTLALIHVVGVYFSLPLYLFFYIRFIGHHSFSAAGLIALIAPIITFLFFEIALKISLPKGYTEPLFYPIFDLFY